LLITFGSPHSGPPAATIKMLKTNLREQGFNYAQMDKAFASEEQGFVSGVVVGQHITLTLVPENTQ
jgi:hypothetical protein